MPLYVGAQNTSTVAGGGGGLEFVSKTTVSSTVSYVEITGLADDTAYHIVGKYIKFDGDGFPKIYMLNSSNGVVSGSDDELTTRRDGSSSGTWNNLDYINAWMPNSPVLGFTIDLQTKSGHTWLLGHFHQSMNTGQTFIASSIEQASSERIGGLRFADGQGNDVLSGSEIIVYKYKES